MRQHIDDQGLGHIILNRPDKHNAFDAELIFKLTQAVTHMGQSPDVRAICLSGHGPSFCAGADAQWMAASVGLSHDENIDDAMRLSDMLAAVQFCPKPLMAIAHGNVFGGGVGLLACADLVVADPNVRLRLSEVRLGLTPATISPFVLAKIGASQARRYFLTAEDINAQTAQQIGLVHEITSDPRQQITLWFQALRQGAPGALTDAKALIRDVSDHEITHSLRAETAQRIAARRASAEGQEGLMAFKERRPPKWIPA